MSTAPIEDDSWSDLAAELGVEAGATRHSPPPTPPVPVPAAAAPEPEPPAEDDADWDDEPEAAGAESDAADAEPDDTMVIPSLHGEPVAEGAAGEAGGEHGDQPGPGGRKRRRRRRRRKKGGPGQPADANGPAEGGPAGEAEDEAGEGDELGDEADADDEPHGLAAAEEPSVEAARDVIANWNVPSWQEIVAGLYRPDR